jgi:hypothetical protein
MTYNVPSELYMNSTEYKINSTYMKEKSTSVIRMSSSQNKYYVKETKNNKSIEMSYNGNTGVAVVYMNGKCVTQTTQKSDISAMVAVIEYTFETATSVGTSTIPHSTLIGDSTTYNQGYLSSSDFDIYSSTSTNQIKYVFKLNDSNVGTVHVFSSDSYATGTTFSTSDLEISACATTTA